MRWSIYLGRPLGIRVYLHFTFLLFIGLLGWLSYKSEGSLFLPAFTLMCFFCVLLHEYGHALMARRYGIGTHDITLLPIGGVARLERMPRDPRQELLVALAGPAVNVAIILLLLPVCYFLKIPVNFSPGPLLNGAGSPGLLQLLLSWNIVMILFNMLPAFPMDGGRVLRALLAMRLPYDRATIVAAGVGRFMALLFAAYAIFGSSNVMLIVIAFFVWSGAGTEAAAAVEQSAMEGSLVRDAMIVDFVSIHPEDTDDSIARLLLNGSQTDFPVMEAGMVTGVVTREVLLAALSREDRQVAAAIMRPIRTSCQVDDALPGVVEILREQGLPLLPVLENERVCGLITPDNTAEYIALRRAVRNRLAELPPARVREG